MLAELMATLDILSPAEQRVGRLVLKNPQHFARMSSAEIARECFVSQPTVGRFCKGLGYDGLTHFKQKIAAEKSGGMPFVHTAVDPSDSSASVSLKVVDNSISSLAVFRAGVPKVSIERASCALVTARAQNRCVSFYGSGHSGMVAQDAQLRFSRLGFSTVACVDGYTQVVNAASRQAGDVVVVISSTGRTKELVDAVDAVKQRSATVMVLTASGSPLANMASIHIATNHQDDLDQCLPMGSRLLQLVVIDILATAVAVKVGSAALHGHLERTQRLLRDRRYA